MHAYTLNLHLFVVTHQRIFRYCGAREELLKKKMGCGFRNDGVRASVCTGEKIFSVCSTERKA